MLTLTSSMDSQIHPPAISTKWNRCVWESFISSSWLRTCLHMAMNGLCQSILYNDLSIILVPKHHHSLFATVGANPCPPEPTAIEIKYHVSFLRLTVELDPNYPT